MSDSASVIAISKQLLSLLPIQRGHFKFESGHHGDMWLDLDTLFARPAALRQIVNELAHRLAAHNIEAVCGPMTGGALLAQMIAEELEIEFHFTERIADCDGSGVFYRLPKSLRPLIRGKRVAIVDDAINAGSAVCGTLAELRAAGAHPVVVGSLIALGTASQSVLAAQKMPLECIAAVSSQLWSPAECPQCAAGVPLSDGQMPA